MSNMKNITEQMKPKKKKTEKRLTYCLGDDGRKLKGFFNYKVTYQKKNKP